MLSSPPVLFCRVPVVRTAWSTVCTCKRWFLWSRPLEPISKFLWSLQFFNLSDKPGWFLSSCKILTTRVIPLVSPFLNPSDKPAWFLGSLPFETQAIPLASPTWICLLNQGDSFWPHQMIAILVIPLVSPGNSFGVSPIWNVSERNVPQFFYLGSVFWLGCGYWDSAPTRSL